MRDGMAAASRLRRLTRYIYRLHRTRYKVLIEPSSRTPLGIEAETLTGQPILHSPHASRVYTAISPDLEARALTRRHAPDGPSSLDCRPPPSRRASEAALNLTCS